MRSGARRPDGNDTGDGDGRRDGLQRQRPSIHPRGRWPNGVPAQHKHYQQYRTSTPSPPARFPQHLRLPRSTQEVRLARQPSPQSPLRTMTQQRVDVAREGTVTADTLTAQFGAVNTQTNTTWAGWPSEPQRRTSSISASIPGFLQVPTPGRCHRDDRAARHHGESLDSGKRVTVGASGNLGASNHGGVTVTLTSGNSDLLLAPDANTASSSTLNVFVPNNQTGLAAWSRRWKADGHDPGDGDGHGDRLQQRKRDDQPGAGRDRPDWRAAQHHDAIGHLERLCPDGAAELADDARLPGSIAGGAVQ